MEEITLDRAHHIMTTHAKTEAAKGLILKHAKQVLSRMETSGVLTKELRKIVLDEFNDLARETQDLLSA
jgi:hypothetical protein